MRLVFVTQILIFIVSMPALATEDFSGSLLEKISPRLENRMQELDENEFITVVVNMKEHEEFKFSKELNRRETLKFLRDQISKNQEPILTYLSAKDKSKVKSVIPFWIFNGLVITVKKDIITELVKREDVLLIETHDYYLPLEQHMNPVKYNFNTFPIPWNILKIRADQVWAQGYMGDDVIIGFIDTGVDTSHPSLIEHFSGLWFDANDSLSRPHGFDGHGTGVTNIAVGGDGPGPFTEDIGVAPGAKFAMAKVTDDFGGLPQQYIFASYEWYASLIDSGVDIRILSCSWGDYWQSLSDWQSLLNLRRLGFIPVFAIGNDSSKIGCPGDYPTVIGVGNTDQNDGLSHVSSWGPAPDHWPWNDTTYWARPDWNLIKPDLCAPGTDIRTAAPGGYTDNTGTSCSCPHVAGVIALMLQKDPSLDYNTIYNSLLDNAVHLGDTVPNNGYGWGRLDALAAINSIPSLGEEYISLMGRYLNELSGNGNGNPDPGETIELRIGLKSYHIGVTGVEATLYSLDPLISVLDSTSYFGDIPADSVVINEEDPFIFEIASSFPAGQKGTFVVNITTQMGGNWCDTLWFTIGEPILHTIFYDDFENGLDNWVADSNWHLTTSLFHSPTHCVMDTVHGVNPDTLVEEILLLAQPLDLSEVHNAELRFWAMNGLYPIMCQWFNVWLTTDPTDPFAWHSVYSFSPPIPSPPDTFIPVAIDISEFAGEDSVFVAFVMSYYYHFPWFFGIDDVEVLADTLIPGVEEFAKNSEPAFYLRTNPNPFCKTTVISFQCPVISEKKKITLSIYDLIGRLVKSFTLTTDHLALSTAVSWDGRDDSGKLLPSGIYYCRLSQGNRTETRKILFVK